MTTRRAFRAMGAILLLAGLGLCVARTVTHERRELEARSGPLRIDSLLRSDPHRTAQTVRLAEVRLASGERFLVELCASGAGPGWEGGLDVVLWRPATESLVFRTQLDAARLRQGRSRGGRMCWTVGLGDVPVTGRYAVEAFWPEPSPRPEIARSRLEIRVAAYRLPGGLDRAGLAVLGLGVLLLVFGLASPPPPGPTPSPGVGLPTLAAGLGGLGAVVLASGLVGGGATGMLLGGALVAAAQLVIVRLGLRTSTGTLAMHRSGRVGLWAPLVVAGLAAVPPIVLQHLVPPSGAAPVEVAIAWPSGKLAFAALGLVVPLAEEAFFRGFVYGILRSRLGGTVAFVGATALFVAAHVPQAFGDWASLGAIAVTGLLLTGLRPVSGALWPSVAAHVLYNASLVAIAWL